MRLACPGTIVLALSACSASRIIWPSSAQPLPPPPWSLATHAGTPRFCALLARQALLDDLPTGGSEQIIRA